MRILVTTFNTAGSKVLAETLRSTDNGGKDDRATVSTMIRELPRGWRIEWGMVADEIGTAGKLHTTEPLSDDDIAELTGATIIPAGRPTRGFRWDESQGIMVRDLSLDSNYGAELQQQFSGNGTFQRAF